MLQSGMHRQACGRVIALPAPSTSHHLFGSSATALCAGAPTSRLPRALLGACKAGAVSSHSRQQTIVGRLSHQVLSPLSSATPSAKLSGYGTLMRSRRRRVASVIELLRRRRVGLSLVTLCTPVTALIGLAHAHVIDTLREPISIRISTKSPPADLRACFA